MPRNTSSSNAKSPPSANEFRITQIFPETSANLKIIGYRLSDQRFAHALSIITSTREAFISDKLQLQQQGSTTPKNKKVPGLLSVSQPLRAFSIIWCGRWCDRLRSIPLNLLGLTPRKTI